MDGYNNFVRGSLVDVVDDDGSILTTGTVIRTGSRHVAVTTEEGETHDVPLAMVRQAGLSKQANKEVLKEEEREGRKFTLVREEQNKDGQLSVVFKVFLNDKPISESEELITNVYDAENGWSAPDDFDENKLDLIKSTYESGFDLIVDSYENIEQAISETTAIPEGGEEPVEPQGKPAFAPGTGPAAGAASDMGGAGAGGDMGGAGEEPPAEGGEAGAEGEAEDTVGPEPHAAPAGETPAEAPAEAAGEATAASLERRSFARSIICTRKIASELLRNPQHRINPVLRSEMERRGIDSGSTNDLELADELRDFDFGEPAPKD